jgi:oxygen-independent coproporphyrinogen-3 oxidase
MSGIYIHVPFCRKKCHYCDFFRTTGTEKIPRYLEALSLEIQLRKNDLGNDPVETIYWGGGTPSVLSPEETAGVLEVLNHTFSRRDDVEITLEANPDDISVRYLEELISAGVKRLSIGIQSLNDRDLNLMNRRHSAESAIRAVELANRVGFSDISIDLIYGIPGQSAESWENTLQQALQLPVNHLSAYHLTYHEGTLFHRWLDKGKLQEITEEESIRQFEMLIFNMEKAGFEHYEISNFARNKAYSRHNTAYWSGKHYLGLGPSAHSYNGISRSWNVSHLGKYITSMLAGKPAITAEILSERDKLNDYIITGIRTQWGISLPEIDKKYGAEVANQIAGEVQKFEKLGWVKVFGGTVTLTTGGMLVSDQITREMILAEDY